MVIKIISNTASGTGKLRDVTCHVVQMHFMPAILQPLSASHAMLRMLTFHSQCSIKLRSDSGTDHTGDGAEGGQHAENANLGPPCFCVCWLVSKISKVCFILFTCGFRSVFCGA